MNEIWKPVKGYETLYEISDKGRLRNAVNKKIRSPYVSDRGYVCATLSKEGDLKRGRIHLLVAEAFIPKKNESDNEVGHKDDNPENNQVSNLYWTNRKDNLKKEAFRLAAAAVKK